MARQIKQYMRDGWYLDEDHFVVHIKNGIAVGYSPYQDKFLPEKKVLHGQDLSPITEQEAKVQMRDHRHSALFAKVR